MKLLSSVTHRGTSGILYEMETYILDDNTFIKCFNEIDKKKKKICYLIMLGDAS